MGTYSNIICVYIIYIYIYRLAGLRGLGFFAFLGNV